MGPDTSTSPVQLRYFDPVSQTWTDLSKDIVGLPTFSIVDGSEESVSCGRACRWCKHADTQRTKDEKIRCKRWSRWVDRDDVCEENLESMSFGFTPEDYSKFIQIGYLKPSNKE